MLLRYFGFLISMTLERASNLQVITYIEPGILRRRFRQFSPMDALKVAISNAKPAVTEFLHRYMFFPSLRTEHFLTSSNKKKLHSKKLSFRKT